MHDDGTVSALQTRQDVFQYLSHKASIDDLDVCLAMRPSVHGDCVIPDDLNVTWFIDVCLAMRPSVHGDCVIPDDLNVT